MYGEDAGWCQYKRKLSQFYGHHRVEVYVLTQRCHVSAGEGTVENPR